jgi:hypothetical protein
MPVELNARLTNATLAMEVYASPYTAIIPYPAGTPEREGITEAYRAVQRILGSKSSFTITFWSTLTISHRYLCLCTPCHLCFALARYSSRYFSIQGGRRGGRPEGQGEAPERQSLAATLELGSWVIPLSAIFLPSSPSIVLRLYFLHLVPIMHIFND